MYNSKVIDTFVSAKNVGDIKGASVQGTFKSKKYGDILKLSLKINENLTVNNATFKAFGGLALSVYASTLCDLIKGKPLKSVKDLSEKQLIESVNSIPVDKQYSAELVIKAYKELVKKYSKKMGLNL